MTSNEARKIGLVTVFSLGVVNGEVSANFERPSRSHFSLDSRQQAILVKAGPPLDLSFWSFLTFLHHGIENVETHLL